MGTSCSCNSADQAVESKLSSDDKLHRDAVASLVADVESATAIPTFEWRCRRGYGNVKVGDAGAKELAVALRDSRHTITTLALQNQSIGDEGCAALASSLDAVPSLTSLNLSRNPFTDKAAALLQSELGKATVRLEKLSIENSSLSTEGVLSVLTAAVRIDSLRTLVVGADAVFSDEVVKVSAQLMGRSSLEELKLCSNGKGFTPSSLGHCFELAAARPTHVRNLVLSNCLHSDEDRGAVATGPMRALGRLLESESCHIEAVELRLPLGNKGVATLAAVLSKCRTLRQLVVSRCEIGCDGLAALAHALRDNFTLHKLDVSHQGTTLEHPIDDTALMRLVQALSHNTGLEELNLMGIALSDGVVAALCDTLEKNDKSSLSSIRHVLIKNSALATRLAQVLKDAAHRVQQRKLHRIQQQQTERKTPPSDHFEVENDLSSSSSSSGGPAPKVDLGLPQPAPASSQTSTISEPSTASTPMTVDDIDIDV